MSPHWKSFTPLALRPLALLALLVCAQIGAAADSWSVISVPQRPGEVIGTAALSVYPAGNLCVADFNRIQRRDTQFVQ